MYPKNPDIIVIKNQFYPNGLTEKNIYNYYMMVKRELLSQVKDRELLFYIATNLNNSILRRYESPNNKYKLNEKNYESLITGRTISIHSIRKEEENFGIIDIDYEDFDKAKVLTLDVFNFLSKLPQIKNVEIRFTGKTSFHVIPYFFRKIPTAQIYDYLYDNFKNSKFSDFCDIKSKRRLGIPNLDLYRNKSGAGFITLYSLSILGLKCMSISEKEILNFKKENAKIE